MIVAIFLSMIVAMIVAMIVGMIVAMILVMIINHSGPLFSLNDSGPHIPLQNF